MPQSNQQAEYIPMPQEQQVAQPNSATGKPVAVSPVETVTVTKKATADWDVFGDF